MKIWLWPSFFIYLSIYFFGLSADVYMWREKIGDASKTKLEQHVGCAASRRAGRVCFLRTWSYFEDDFWKKREREVLSPFIPPSLPPFSSGAVCHSGSGIWVVFDAIQQAVCLGSTDRAVTSPEQEKMKVVVVESIKKNKTKKKTERPENPFQTDSFEIFLYVVTWWE